MGIGIQEIVILLVVVGMVLSPVVVLIYFLSRTKNLPDKPGGG